MAEHVIVEIERVLELQQLPSEEQGQSTGYEIGKALRSLKHLDRENAWFQQIEDVLKLENLPPVQQQNQQQGPSEIARLFYSLKELARKRNEEDAVASRDKAFINYAKNTATAYASTFNALNIFGTAMSYTIGDRSHRIKEHHNIHGCFIALTMIFLPLSLLAVGFANSLDSRKRWINRVAWMLMLEAVYMGVMCGLLGYYLLDYSSIPIVAIITITGVLGVAFPPWVVFRRPNIVDACLGQHQGQ